MIGGSRLTHRAYAQLGGVVGGLASWCDEAYQGLSSTQRPVARRVMTALVRPGDESAGDPPTRQRRALSELRAAEARTEQEDDAQVDAVVVRLADRRLLVTSRDPAISEPVVELVHEALIREWGQLRQWIAEDHDFLTWRHRLEARYAEWNASSGLPSGPDPELLLRGSGLDEAQYWLDLRPAELSSDLVDFIQLSDSTQRQRLNRDRRRIRLLATLLVIVLGLGAFAAVQVVRERQQRRVAVSRAVAAQSIAFHSTDQTRALLLATAAVRIAPTVEANSNLLNLAAREPLTSILAEHFLGAC